MLRFFSSDEEVIRIGITAFRIIGWSFLPLVTSLTYPVLFQAVGQPVKSSALTVIRTVILFVPLGYLFSLIGLDYFWLTYPVTDGLTTIVGFLMCLFFFKKAYTQASLEKAKAEHDLTGNYKGCRECHVEPDWLLIYEVMGDVLVLMLYRVGSHSELFK